MRVEELVGALRSIQYGGVDDATRSFALPPQIRATVSPLINSLRWGALTVGIVFAAQRALDGDLQVVVTTAVCMFVTCWRTAMPVRLASERMTDRVTAVVDVAILSLGIGASGGLDSPFIYCLLAAIAVLSFGWGAWAALIGLVTGAIALTAGLSLAGHGISPDSQENWGAAIAIAITAAIVAFVRSRLLDAEKNRAQLAGRVGALAETNDLLTMLNGMARTLPTSLNVREALESMQQQLVDTFEPRVVCLLEFDDGHEDWVPKLAEGCVLKPTMTRAELPPRLGEALASAVPVLAETLTADEAIDDNSTSGLYARLEARGHVVGLLGVETSSRSYTERDRRLLTGFCEVAGLTFDNARWFGRLRSLGAEGERVRIARDLHDRLGQWLTYISFELERINMTAPDPELLQLHSDVVSALDELRETLRQLRTGVSDAEPLTKVAGELIGRLRDRTDLEISFDVVNPQAHLPIPVENEMLRIMQEALNNVEKHAAATVVNITWDVHDGIGTLTVRDNGRGFDRDRGVRDSAYGLVGMRERADVIGARLSIESAPGVGTTVTVTSGPTTEKQE